MEYIECFWVMRVILKSLLFYIMGSVLLLQCGRAKVHTLNSDTVTACSFNEIIVSKL